MSEWKTLSQISWEHEESLQSGKAPLILKGLIQLKLIELGNKVMIEMLNRKGKKKGTQKQEEVGQPTGE